ncbi:glycoside hydrolase family 31 protein [Lacticaseibacillus parakribbianus]|uniref:glycoside hydrolase family 31 protein n=1 Tax=Lacticaseibacillus parakribbianus TaxID=2970927 RepID=UPI0021CB0F42|nr:glycoside hydrolase family 31 protein [Lacticaseibacillus parakribbianus]
MKAIQSVEQEGQLVTITYADGQLNLQVVTPQIVRVQHGPWQPGHSYAIAGDKVQAAPYQVDRGSQEVVVTTAALKVVADAEGFVDLFDAAGTPLVQDFRGPRHALARDLSKAQADLAAAEGHDLAQVEAANANLVVKVLHEHEHLYGLGDKAGFMDKRGYEYDMWNTDNPVPQLENRTRLYKTVPFMIGLNDGHAYGLFFDSTERSHFDLGKESSDYFYYTSAIGTVDYYLIAGAGIPGVLEAYTYLTGRTPLPQKWTLGYQQSRWSYGTEAQVNYIADKMREYRLPCDVIHLDIDYMDGYRVFTVDHNHFPHFASQLSDLAKKGIKIVTIIDPGVKEDPGYHVYDEGVAQGLFAKNTDGSVYVNAVWPGAAVYPDFGRAKVRDWWANNVKFLTDNGVAGVWNDMNEPASFKGEIPDDIVFSDGDQPSTHATMHNVYGHNMSQATYDGLREQTGKRPFVISRAVYAGSQKYATVWTGDNHSLWVHLQWSVPLLCNLGLSGFAFAGTDIGGFGSDTTPELLTRWIEAAIFSPLLRNHSAIGTRAQEPWRFGEKTLGTYRKFLELRYHLIDYLYDLFEAGTRTGLPVMRPLAVHYPQDERAATINDEFLVGADLLAAPVLTPNTAERLVYLPAGEWCDFWTGKAYAGGRSYVIAAPLDALPLFARVGAILPWRPLTQYVDVATETTLGFKCFGNTGTYSHYQDDGESFAYETGAYNRYAVTVQNGAAKVTLTHQGYAKPYQTITVAVADGAVQTLTYDAATGSYRA